MVKKLVTIDVEDKELKKTAKSVSAKKTKTVEKNEVENFGIVEINNTSSAKKVSNKAEKGFEKNVSTAAKRTVKAKTSKVDDYFDFSFRVNSTETAESETPALKMEESAKEVVAETVVDNEASRIIMVARLGSLFGCDARMINA